jgi:hypothetical protein
MLVFHEAGQDGIQTVENALTRTLQERGYHILDRAAVATLLQREAEILRQYDVEAAKQLGSRLGATIVISGKSRTRVREKTYSSLGGKKVTISQANVSAKAVLVHSGKVLAAENAHARKPFDATGDLALEGAAEQLAEKLTTSIDRFLARDTIDYRLVVLNLSHNDALSLQQALRAQVEGIEQIHEHGFTQNTLELDVRVNKLHDLPFKRRLYTHLSLQGVGRFEVVAREGETVYLRKTGESGDVPPSETSGPRTQLGSHLPPSATTTTAPATHRAGYRKRWAVLIGINDYETWPKLAYAVKDAEEVSKRVRAMGFDEVIPMMNKQATQRNILRVLGDELYAKTHPEDQVFIFFAGHGQTQDLPDGKKVGYIIPVDGDVSNYYSTAISMRQLQALSDRLKAKHILYVMDSCFSGLLTQVRGLQVAPIQRHYALHTQFPVRQVLTAGSEGEEVVEVGGHGLFTKALLQGLDGEADVNGDGHITASELSQFVTPRIMQASRNAQNPLFTRFGGGRGNFVFTRPR